MKLGGAVALGYYSFAMAVLLLEYFSEGDKLSRGMHTDTFSPFIWTEVISWPSSAFLPDWKGYPGRFDHLAWQRALNASLPAHLWAVAVHAVLLFLLIQAAGAARLPGRRGHRRARGDR